MDNLMMKCSNCSNSNIMDFNVNGAHVLPKFFFLIEKMSLPNKPMKITSLMCLKCDKEINQNDYFSSPALFETNVAKQDKGVRCSQCGTSNINDLYVFYTWADNTSEDSSLSKFIHTLQFSPRIDVGRPRQPSTGDMFSQEAIMREFMSLPGMHVANIRKIICTRCNNDVTPWE